MNLRSRAETTTHLWEISGKVDSGVLAAAGRGSRVGYRESLPKLENLERQLWTQAHRKQSTDEVGPAWDSGTPAL